MIALHGIWSSSKFYVWAEYVEPHEGDEFFAPAERHESDSAGPHPRALSAPDLHAAIGERSPDALLASVAGDATLDLRLPCSDELPDVPVAPSLSASNARLRTFGVPALMFAPADAIDLLTGLSASAAKECGDSLRFWGILARYTLSLLARQQFVPDVEGLDEDRFVGRWRLFVSDREELAWLRRLVGAMPPVCRSIANGASLQHAATGLADSFIADTAEALIRRSVADDPFYEQLHQRAKNEAKWEVRWLSALLGADNTRPWKEEDSPAIVGRIHAWIGQLEHDTAENPPELCLTLIEPAGLGDECGDLGSVVWRLRIDLRAPDDGELLDLAQVWQQPSDAPSILGQHLVNQREQLRGELLRAVAIFPQLEKALTATVPQGVNLTTADAHALIRDGAPLLRAQDIHVNLPEWATTDHRRLGLELFVGPPEGEPADAELSLGSIGLNSMLDFNWKVAIGDDQVSIEEFETLVAQGSPLVRTRGRWVDVDQEAAKKALVFLKSQPSGRLTLAEAIRLLAGTEDPDAGLPVVGLSGTAWVERFLAESPETTLQHLEQPADFHGTLRPYQVRGLDWLAFLDQLGIGACLADDMGLGKTIQLIALLLHERSDGQKVGPTLLFVPMSVVGNWQREIRRFGPSLRVLVHHGPQRLVGKSFIKAARKHDVIVTTYGLANRDLKALQDVNWHRITLDEAQKIKNPSANQTIAIRKLQAPHHVAMTGTPLENHTSELWSIMEMLNPGVLGSATTFRRQYSIPIEKMGDRNRAEQLRRLIRPFILRRLKTDPNVECDLPEKMEMSVYCNLTPEQAALYSKTVQSMLGEVEQADGIRRRGLILATLTRLKQLCNHPTQLLRDGGPLPGRSGKCERLVEMLDEVLEEGDAALVFTQYKVMGDLLQTMLDDRLHIKVPFLHGSSTRKQREEMIDEFQDPDSGTDVFLLSLRAGGFGLNLTKANHVFHFDRWWNPAVERQATDRAHRIGQTRRVQVHKFVCIGTIEDRIDRLLADKSALADQIVGSGDEWLTGLSTVELRDYLALTPEALVES